MIVDKSCHTWYGCRCWTKLITQFDRTWSWFTSIVLTVFTWSSKVNAPKEEKRAWPFSSSTPRRKKTTKSFCHQRVGFDSSRDKGSYYNLEKWLKDDKAPEKPIETTAESSFTSSLASGASLLGPRSSQARDEVARGPAPYKNRTKYCFESLL